MTGEWDWGVSEMLFLWGGIDRPDKKEGETVRCTFADLDHAFSPV